MSRVAAIDIGTNSFLCLIVEKRADGSLQTLSDEVEIVRLGQDVDRTRILQPQALERARKTLRRFKEKIDKFQPNKIMAVATSAARDVQNVQDLEKIFEGFQIPLKVISGEKEAELTFQGAISGQNIEGDLAVLDIGGGSTEIIFGNEMGLGSSKSLDIGAVRITEMFFSKQPPTSMEVQKAEAFIDQNLDMFFTETSRPFSRVIAVAGTPTELVSAKVGGYDPKKIDNYQLSMSELLQYIKDFSSMDVEARIKILKISPGRADIILAGTLILQRALLKFKKDNYFVSTRGLRYGLAKELLA